MRGEEVACHWLSVTENQPFCQFIFRAMFFLSLSKRRRWRKRRSWAFHPPESHTSSRSCTHTRAQETFCFSATRQLWLLSSIFSPRLLFSPSICLSVRLSEENGSWWAASFLMTWLIWGRLACSSCVLVCGCVCVHTCVISFSHSNSKNAHWFSPANPHQSN